MTYCLAHLPLKRLLPVTGLFLCAVSLPTSLSALTQDEDRARLQQIQQDIHKLQALLQKIRSERSNIENHLEETEREISKVSKQRAITEKQLEEARLREKKQLAKRKELELELAKKRQDVALSIKAAYVAGQSPHLKLLLNQDDTSQTHRMLSYYQFFNKNQTDTLRTLYETSEKLTMIEQELIITKQQVQDRHQRLSQQEQQLQNSKKLRSKTLQELSGELSRGNNRLAQLEREQQNLQKLLASVMAAPASAKPVAQISEVPFSKVRGKLRWPLKGKVIHEYGERRDNTRFRWNGIFIKANAGAQVIAPHNGRVVFSDWMPSFGQLLIIDHGNGYMTLYAHNQELLRNEGDWVLSGEPIARVGDSGGLSNPGLYFEVRHKGKPSNPAIWLTASR